MKRNKKGQFRISYFDRLFPIWFMIFTASLCKGLQLGAQAKAWEGANNANAGWIQQTTTPTPTPTLSPTPTPSPSPTPTPTESDYIELAIDEFLPKKKSESLMIMHCLAYRESGHGTNKAHGDSGLAGGPFQFHQATWVRMRKQMGEPESSRYDFKEAARTTAWAIANGRALEWGPIKRYHEGSTFNVCQYPSWYK